MTDASDGNPYQAPSSIPAPSTKPAKNQSLPEKNFEQQAAGAQIGLVREFTEFLLNNKKWWLTPIVLVLLLIGFLIALGGTGVAPFIYTLF